MNRLFSKRQRLILAFLSGGKCSECGTRLTRQNYHADHVIPFSRGGETNTRNGAALCAACNLKKGNQMKTKIRPWQKEAIAEAMQIYKQGERNFLINAAPGAGKTYAAALLAKELLDQDMIDRVVVIAPRKKVVAQWAKQFRQVTSRKMMKVTPALMRALDSEDLEEDIAATWNGVQGLRDALQAVCKQDRVLVIGDEVHHAALGAVWGDGTSDALTDARYVLALTGTPTRSDGISPIWIDESIEARYYYNLSYEYAIREGWCIPVTLHRHAGQVDVDWEGQKIEIRNTGTTIPANISLPVYAKGKLRFDKIIKEPWLEDDNKTPRKDGYHATMMEWANSKLDDLRSRAYGNCGMPNAGGLVLAPNIEMADYFTKLIRRLWPEEIPDQVTSNIPSDAAEIIMDRFAKGTKKWIVAVNMISEGVDIPRLRVMVLLPNSQTELFFRQAVGRVIRKDESNGNPDDDNSRAYCVMPFINRELVGKDTFAEFSLRLEDDMGDVEAPEEKPERPIEDFWDCSDWSEDGCGAVNNGGTKCHNCGLPRYKPQDPPVISLEQALGYRDGATVRGDDFTEEEVLKGEEEAPEILGNASEINDPRINAILGRIPEESWGLIKPIFK